MGFDFRTVLRSLLHARIYSLAAILIVGLGIGVNIAIFAVVDRVLFRPLPFGQPSDLYSVHRIDMRRNQVFSMLPRALVVDIRRSLPLVTDVGYAGNTRPYLLEGADNPPLRLAEATYNLLDVLQVAPVAGRTFVLEDALARRRLILLRAEVWRARYAGSPAIFGRVLRDGKGTAEVIGILPLGFVFPSVNWAVPADGLILAADTLSESSRGEMVPGFVVRLKPDSMATQLRSQIQGLIAAESRTGIIEQSVAVTVQPLREGMFWNYRMSFQILFAGGCLMWLLSCVNVGTLMTSRARARDRQTVIRKALGAPPSRLVWPIVAEAGVLCVAGAATASVLMAWCIHLLPAFVPTLVSQLTLKSMDDREIGFVICGTLPGCLLAASYPIRHAMRANGSAAAAVRSDSARIPNGHFLIMLATTLSIILLLAGLSAWQGYRGLLSSDLGFRPTGLDEVNVRLATGRVMTVSAYRYIIDVLHAQPGVSAASGADTSIASGDVPDTVADASGARYVTRRIFDNYFQVMGTRVIAGRAFTREEVEKGIPVCVLSESAARQMWAGIEPEQAVGRNVHLRNFATATVVGIVGDTRVRHGLPRQSEFFTPWTAESATPRFFLRLTDGHAIDIISLRADISRQFGPASVSSSHVADLLRRWLDDPKLYANVFGAFAALGFAITLIGLAALAAHEVVLRQHEFAIRTVLGASDHQLRLEVLRQVLIPVFAGVVVGVIISFWASKYVQSLVAQPFAIKSAAYPGAVALLLAGATLAAWLPARKISQDLARALRRNETWR